MNTGRVTFISAPTNVSDALSWRARQVIGQADIVIWAGGDMRPEILRAAPEYADIVTDVPASTHALLPFYDLASRDGFRIAHIRADVPVRWEQVFDHVDRCGELGLRTELVRG